MALRLPDKWVWDFWLVRDTERHHIFYLQAPRSLGAPTLRHHHASIGHAVSDDLSTWAFLPDALAPGPDGSWDDLATWTGSVVARDDRWHMLYTGISRRDGGLVQRIGLASSDDLIRWEKHPANPVLEADPRWYDLLDFGRWRDQSWRDPWVFPHPDGSFRALTTARSRVGEPDAAGVVGHARSVDLIDWEVLPPITAAGEFAQVEVPQLVRLDGSYSLLVSCQAEDHSRARRERLGAPGETGTFVLSSDELLGPYEPAAWPLAPPSGPLGPLYAGKLVEIEPGGWRFWLFAATATAASWVRSPIRCPFAKTKTVVSSSTVQALQWEPGSDACAGNSIAPRMGHRRREALPGALPVGAPADRARRA